MSKAVYWAGKITEEMQFTAFENLKPNLETKLNFQTKPYNFSDFSGTTAACVYSQN